MARYLRRRARLGYYDVVAWIDVAVVCVLFVGLCLCEPLQANPNSLARAQHQNQTEAQDVEALLVAGEQGDAEAQFTLGARYESGRGVAQDAAVAVRWYRRAAQQEHVTAQFRLGGMYRDGRGVPQDDLQAVRWFYFAANQRHIRAASNLGWMYQNGRGIPQNDGEAVRLYRLAADQGLAEAQYNLGLMYDLGQAVPQDRVAAHMWLTLAAARAPEAMRDQVVTARDAVEEEMTAKQVAEAQRLAREWKPIDQR